MNPELRIPLHVDHPRIPRALSMALESGNVCSIRRALILTSSDPYCSSSFGEGRNQEEVERILVEQDSLDHRCGLVRMEWMLRSGILHSMFRKSRITPEHCHLAQFLDALVKENSLYRQLIPLNRSSVSLPELSLVSGIVRVFENTSSLCSRVSESDVVRTQNLVLSCLLQALFLRLTFVLDRLIALRRLRKKVQSDTKLPLSTTQSYSDTESGFRDIESGHSKVQSVVSGELLGAMIAAETAVVFELFARMDVLCATMGLHVIHSNTVEDWCAMAKIHCLRFHTAQISTRDEFSSIRDNMADWFNRRSMFFRTLFVSRFLDSDLKWSEDQYSESLDSTTIATPELLHIDEVTFGNPVSLFSKLACFSCGDDGGHNSGEGLIATLDTDSFPEFDSALVTGRLGRTIRKRLTSHVFELYTFFQNQAFDSVPVTLEDDSNFSFRSVEDFSSSATISGPVFLLDITLETCIRFLEKFLSLRLFNSVEFEDEKRAQLNVHPREVHLNIAIILCRMMTHAMSRGQVLKKSTCSHIMNIVLSLFRMQISFDQVESEIDCCPLFHGSPILPLFYEVCIRVIKRFQSSYSLYYSALSGFVCLFHVPEFPQLYVAQFESSKAYVRSILDHGHFSFPWMWKIPSARLFWSLFGSYLGSIESKGEFHDWLLRLISILDSSRYRSPHELVDFANMICISLSFESAFRRLRLRRCDMGCLGRIFVESLPSRLDEGNQKRLAGLCLLGASLWRYFSPFPHRAYTITTSILGAVSPIYRSVSQEFRAVQAASFVAVATLIQTNCDDVLVACQYLRIPVRELLCNFLFSGALEFGIGLSSCILSPDNTLVQNPGVIMMKSWRGAPYSIPYASSVAFEILSPLCTRAVCTLLESATCNIFQVDHISSRLQQKSCVLFQAWREYVLEGRRRGRKISVPYLRPLLHTFWRVYTTVSPALCRRWSLICEDVQSLSNFALMLICNRMLLDYARGDTEMISSSTKITQSLDQKFWDSFMSCFHSQAQAVDTIVYNFISKSPLLPEQGLTSSNSLSIVRNILLGEWKKNAVNRSVLRSFLRMVRPLSAFLSLEPPLLDNRVVDIDTSIQWNGEDLREYPLTRDFLPWIFSILEQKMFGDVRLDAWSLFFSFFGNEIERGRISSHPSSMAHPFRHIILQQFIHYSLVDCPTPGLFSLFPSVIEAALVSFEENSVWSDFVISTLIAYVARSFGDRSALRPRIQVAISTFASLIRCARYDVHASGLEGIQLLTRLFHDIRCGALESLLSSVEVEAISCSALSSISDVCMQLACIQPPERYHSSAKVALTARSELS